MLWGKVPQTFGRKIWKTMYQVSGAKVQGSSEGLGHAWEKVVKGLGTLVGKVAEKSGGSLDNYSKDPMKVPRS